MAKLGKVRFRKSAKWLLPALVISAAAFGNGADVGATLAAKGVTVDGKVCRETERRNFADGWADSIAERYPVAENVRGHENIEWSVSYAFHLTDENKDLPRVLLVGHSTCQGYQGKVRSKLEGKANVTYWTSSYCVTSPGFLRLLAFYLDEAKYDVVHFNNGGHSGGTPIADYEKSYRAALELVRKKQPGAKLLWSSSTPLNTEDAARAEKVVQLNDAARRAAQGVGGILENDLFALMDPLERSEYWTDAHHFKDAGYELIASQVVEKVTAALANWATLTAKGVVVNGQTCSKIERRDFADGWAVRYVLPSDGDRFVEREETIWTLPGDAKVWYQEYGMDYEKPYSSSLVREIPAGTVMDFPVTAKLSDGTYRLITEANVVGYTDSAAKYLGNGSFTVFYVNEPQGFAQTAAKGTPLPGTTPWRVMLVAKDIQTLATSDIVRRLCPDPSPEVAAKAAAFVKSGRAVWQWLPAGNPKYEEQKEWFDRTKKLGFEYYLIDAGWRDWQDGDMDQWACLKKWIDYGKSIGVESFIWVHSKELMDPAARRTYLAKVKATGAVGIKIDFHPAAKCAQMAWYEETLAETLEFSLMTDFHGAVKPSGREKTWPHEVAREAIRGHEWHITRYDRVLPPEHDCILPFNRLVQGHADYTPVVFEKKELVGYTWARELAQGVVFSAPFLCFGDYPKNYLENPAAELIKAMPATYDETHVLAGSEIGECVAVAKRKGRDWFIAIENGAQERRMTVALDFLGDGKYELLGFADADDRPDGYRIDRRVVDRNGKIELALRPSGGYCARIAPEGESSSANDGGGSGEFVAAARRAYAGDPMCRTTIVTNFAVRGKPDDKTPGLVLWYDVEGARNVRDIGGWTGLRTRRVFRGTALNSKPNHRQYELTERGRAVMRGEMGIASDLDLRGEIAEYGEDAKTKSPIGEGVQLLSRPVSSYVETCTSPRSAKAFAAALRVFADEKNYPVYVHCAGGADRTGTVCFLLETLCGVSLEDATIEYELTSFSPVGVRRRDSETGLPFALMVRLLSSFPGETFNDKVAYWAENVAGLSKDEIERIRLNLVNRQ